MEKIHARNYLDRAFRGWLNNEVWNERVPEERNIDIEGMGPIALASYRDLFERFLIDRPEHKDTVIELEREYGAIETLTYFNG